MNSLNYRIKVLKFLKLFFAISLFFCCNLITFANNKVVFNKEELIKRLKTMKMASSCDTRTGVEELETVKFGSYQQYKDQYEIYNKESVEWILLYGDNDNAYLMSKYVLDSLPYNTEKPVFERGAYIYDSNIYGLASDWKYSTLRKWMNETMYNELFSDVIKNMKEM